MPVVTQAVTRTWAEGGAEGVLFVHASELNLVSLTLNKCKAFEKAEERRGEERSDLLSGALTQPHPGLASLLSGPGQVLRSAFSSRLSGKQFRVIRQKRPLAL